VRCEWPHVLLRARKRLVHGGCGSSSETWQDLWRSYANHYATRYVRRWQVANRDLISPGERLTGSGTLAAGRRIVHYSYGHDEFLEGDRRKEDEKGNDRSYSTVSWARDVSGTPGAAA
jgi:hypothetical protein